MSENNQNLKQNKVTTSKSKSKSKPFYHKKRNSSKKTLESKVNDILLYEKIDVKKISESKIQAENIKQSDAKKQQESKKKKETKRSMSFLLL